MMDWNKRKVTYQTVRSEPSITGRNFKQQRNTVY